MTPAPLRTAGLLLRAVLGLVVLAALVAGVPYLLLAVGHQPTELADGGFSLLEQDDGRLFLVVLTCLGWAGWAAFTLSVLVELVAVLRRRSAPKIRGLGSMQSLASFLVGGIVLLAPTAASAATVAPAMAASVTHTVGEAGTTAGAPSMVSARAGETGGLTHTVASASELPWDLAEDYLGDGKRWKDIAALNPDIPQLAAGDQYLPKGAVIKLPAGARPAAAAAPAAKSAGQAPASVTRVDTPPASGATAPKTSTTDTNEAAKAQEETEADRVTVRAGDSLWSIADAHGDPEDWPAIYEANRGEAVPGGGTFTDPNKIYPGQVLDLPQHTDPQPATPERPAPKPAVPAQPDAPKPPASPAPAPTADADADKGAPPAAETAVPSRTAPAPEHSAAPADDTVSAPATPAPERTSPAPPSTAPEPAGQASETSSAGIVLAAAGSLAAAGGVVVMLRRRRALQRRRRPAGHHIAMPTGRAAVTEQALRSVDSSAELLFLDAALRMLAVQMAAQSRDLPPLDAVQLGKEGVLLHLSDTDESADLNPVVPFTTVMDRPGLWWCPADTTDLLDEDLLPDIAAPYPALVLLGSDTDGGLLLVDLDEFGALHLTGSRHLQMLRTLGISLALSPLGQVDVAVAGEDTAPGLGLLDAQRVQEHPDLQAAADSARTHHTGQQQLMADTGLPGMSRARLSPEAEEFSPLVVLADLDTCPSPDATGQLDALLRDQPLSSTTLITSSTQAARGTGEVWEIDTDLTDFSVPNTPLRCVLSMCSDDEYADILTLAVTSDSAAGVPAPPPVPLDTLLPGADAAGVTVPPPPAPAPPAGGKPSLLALLSDLDDEDEGEGEGDDVSEGAPAQPLAGDSTDTGATETPAAPDGSAHSPRPSGTPDSGTAGTAAGAGGATAAVPVLPASAFPSHVVLPAARNLPQITVRLPASTTEPEPTSATDASADTGADGRDAAVEIVFPEGQPLVSILGTVEVTGARGTVDSNRRTRATELAAFLVLNPGATAHQIDEVLSPRGGLTSSSTRNTRLRDVRRWLGNDDDNKPYFRRMAKHTDGHRIVGVECDWIQFQLLHDAALQLPRAQGQALLHRALELVRGRPFSGVSATYYSWAEPVVEEINDRVVNAAALLADWCLEAGDGRGALWAAGRGLDVAREREQLWRHRFRALALLGDHDGLEQSIQRLETLLTDHGWAMEEETADTIRMVQATRA
ncbi:LysM peptidoglycan-binding domain-containing protein [Streptomyces hydrogenans]|uniref:LysM peptidoglycan-binding domain-containing protein n=1 Tax=Streptomyces hydrogenans TaxID=1873719 RepID=UPI0036F10B83